MAARLGHAGALHETLKLSFPVLETLFHQFRNQQLLEVKGMVGNDYSFTLTASGPRAGQRRAMKSASMWDRRRYPFSNITK